AAATPAPLSLHDALPISLQLKQSQRTVARGHVNAFRAPCENLARLSLRDLIGKRLRLPDLDRLRQSGKRNGGAGERVKGTNAVCQLVSRLGDIQCRFRPGQLLCISDTLRALPPGLQLAGYE